LANKRHHKK